MKIPGLELIKVPLLGSPGTRIFSPGTLPSGRRPEPPELIPSPEKNHNFIFMRNFGANENLTIVAEIIHAGAKICLVCGILDDIVKKLQKSHLRMLMRQEYLISSAIKI